MADQNFHYPSETGTYTLPSGDTLRITFWYDDGTAADDTDMDGSLIKLFPIDNPRDINIGGTFRLAKTKLEFSNPSEEFEDGALYNATYKDQTFIKVIYNGSELWRGRVIWEKVLKKKWYDTGAGLSFRTFQVYAVDILDYLRNNDLDDVSYADGQTFDTILDNIATEVGLTGVDTVAYDTCFNITETVGRSYVLSEQGAPGSFDDNFRARNLSGTWKILDFLNSFQKAFACSVFTEGGYLKCQSRNDGSAYDIDVSATILSAQKVRDPHKYKYIKISAIKDWEGDFGTNVALADYEHAATYGALDNDTSRNLELVVTDIFQYVHIVIDDAGNQDYPAFDTVNPDNTGDEDHIDYAAGDFHGPGDEIESGMPIFYNYDFPTADGQSITTGTTSSTRVDFIDIDVATDNTETFYIRREWDANYRLDKVQKCVQASADIYNDYLFGGDPLKIKVAGVLTNTTKLYDFNGDKFVPYKTLKDLYKDETTLFLRQVV